eukprot:5671686-Pleurochrysis_carterae.AAC.1
MSLSHFVERPLGTPLQGNVPACCKVVLTRTRGASRSPPSAQPRLRACRPRLRPRPRALSRLHAPSPQTRAARAPGAGGQRTDRAAAAAAQAPRHHLLTARHRKGELLRLEIQHPAPSNLFLCRKPGIQPAHIATLVAFCPRGAASRWAQLIRHEVRSFLPFVGIDASLMPTQLPCRVLQVLRDCSRRAFRTYTQHKTLFSNLTNLLMICIVWTNISVCSSSAIIRDCEDPCGFAFASTFEC